jgi:hypothetical protein
MQYAVRYRPILRWLLRVQLLTFVPLFIGGYFIGQSNGWRYLPPVSASLISEEPEDFG